MPAAISPPPRAGEAGSGSPPPPGNHAAGRFSITRTARRCSLARNPTRQHLVGFLPGGLPFLPFPAKIRVQVLEPIDLRERFGEDPDWDEAYDYVSSYMQVGLAELASRTLLPVVG